MRLVIAPDKFKGTATARAESRAVADRLEDQRIARARDGEVDLFAGAVRLGQEVRESEAGDLV